MTFRDTVGLDTATIATKAGIYPGDAVRRARR